MPSENKTNLTFDNLSPDEKIYILKYRAERFNAGSTNQKKKEQPNYTAKQQNGNK